MHPLLDGHLIEAMGLCLPSGEGASSRRCCPIGAMGVGLVDADELVLVFEGERVKQDGLDYGEERDIGADAESHDEDCEEGESGGARQGANAVAEIVEQEFEVTPAPCVACLLAQEGWVAKHAQSGETGFCRSHAGGDVFGDLLIEMELQLVLQVSRLRGRGGRAFEFA